VTTLSHRPCVAIVDDEPDIVLYLRAALEDNGYRVVTTSDATGALELLIQVTPDVICLDVVMPRHTGAALYAEIRRHPDLGRCPVVIVSGLGEGVSEALEKVAPGRPPDRILAKPVDLDELLGVLDSIVASGAEVP
jgi:CheY-like chemotaxis protein